jgi:hypothetical protein
MSIVAGWLLGGWCGGGGVERGHNRPWWRLGWQLWAPPEIRWLGVVVVPEAVLCAGVVLGGSQQVLVVERRSRGQQLQRPHNGARHTPRRLQ